MFLFLHFYTIHKEKLTEKKGKVSTNTMHYDKSGKHILQCYVQFVQPTPEIWMLSGLKKTKVTTLQSKTAFFLNLWTNLCRISTKTEDRSAPENFRTDLRYWSHAWCTACMDLSWHRWGYLLIHTPWWWLYIYRDRFVSHQTCTLNLIWFGCKKPNTTHSSDQKWANSGALWRHPTMSSFLFSGNKWKTTNTPVLNCNPGDLEDNTTVGANYTPNLHIHH